MNVHFTKIYYLSIALLAALALGITPPVQARLSSLSPVETITINGQSQQQVFAGCGTRDQRPKLVRKVGERLWCDSVFTDMCHNDKARIADRVCSLSYANKLKALGKTTDTIATTTKKRGQINRIELRKEALDIEIALMDIQAARLEIRKRELQLMKDEERKKL